MNDFQKKDRIVKFNTKQHIIHYYLIAIKLLYDMMKRNLMKDILINFCFIVKVTAAHNLKLGI